MTTVSLQAPERESLAADEPSVAATNRPRRPGILHVLVPHSYIGHSVKQGGYHSVWDTGHIHKCA